MSNIPNLPVDVLRPLVEAAWNKTDPGAWPSDQLHAIEETYGLIDRGRLRVASQGESGQWEVHTWVKQAILLYFRTQFVSVIDSPPFQWTDKIPVKRWDLERGVRVVPPAVVRYGAYIARGCVLMPSYVNVGAYVDEGTMVDTWATVGSCAQIGKNVHLSGGVGIGGVLEPPQAAPVIVEDNCFVGSRCVIVEGVHVKRGAVLGAGLVLTKSTPIIDTRVAHGEPTRGVIPENAVVIPGSMKKSFLAGEFHTPCALIIGERSRSTDEKTSLNQALREFDVPV